MLQDALNALVTLGIGRSMAENALSKIEPETIHHFTLEEIIKKALKNL